MLHCSLQPTAKPFTSFMFIHTVMYNHLCSVLIIKCCAVDSMAFHIMLLPQLLKLGICGGLTKRSVGNKTAAYLNFYVTQLPHSMLPDRRDDLAWIVLNQIICFTPCADEGPDLLRSGRLDKRWVGIMKRKIFWYIAPVRIQWQVGHCPKRMAGSPLGGRTNYIAWIHTPASIYLRICMLKWSCWQQWCPFTSVCHSAVLSPFKIRRLVGQNSWSVW